MNYLTIIQLLIVIAYPFIIGKILPSISDSYYYLKDKNKSHFFYYYTGSLGVLMLFQSAIMDYKEIVQAIFMVAGFFLPAISIAASFKKKEERWIHLAATYISIALVIAGVTIQLWNNTFWSIVISLCPLLAIVGAVIYFRNHFNKTWWIEHSAEFVLLIPLLFLPK